MVEINECLICGSKQSEPFLICKDYTVSKKDFTIRICKDCGFKFTSPRPEDKDLAEYYKAESYVSHSDTKKGLVNTLYHWVRSYTLIKKLQLVMHYTGLKQGKILDYGAGTGAFLEMCKKNEWETIGIEPDETAKKVMLEKFKISSYISLADAAFDKLFNNLDVITAWHVLEHVPDLKETIQTFKNILKEKGILIIAVPNPNSHDAKYYKEYWAAYDVPRHLWHFAPEHMIRLCTDKGFKLIEIRPMAFDSFYVSMLSEQYKSGRSGLIKAFWRGLVSNIKANRTAKEFSSQIYIFRKP